MKELKVTRFRFHHAVGLSLAILLANLIFLTFAKDDWSKTVFSDLTLPIEHMLAVALLLLAARKSMSLSRRLGLGWGILAFAQLIYGLGEISWGILELGYRQDPFPSIADAFYLAYYPLFLLGIHLFPTRRLSKINWLKSMLDMSIMILASALGFWIFLIGPLVQAGTTEPLTTQLLSVAYPAGDLLLIWAALVMLYRRPQGIDRIALAFLIASVSSMVITDCLFSYQSISETYISGSLVDLGWLSALLCAGLAGAWQFTHTRPVLSTENTGSSEPARKSILETSLPYLPYIWVAAAYSLLVINTEHQFPINHTALTLSIGGIIMLVVLRQILTLIENGRLFSELHVANARMQNQTLELDQANKELQAEISIRLRAEEQLMHDALHDALTGLPNRVLFIDRLSHSIEYTKRHEEYKFAVLFLDLDKFKVINDSLGHAIGDQLLIAIAQRLRFCVRSTDVTARLGGDEFVILLEDTKDQASVVITLERIRERLCAPFSLEGHKVFVSASIGVVLSDLTYTAADEVMRDADIAMYQAKSLGKDRYEIFNPSLRDQAIIRLELENDLREALERNEFILQYQPIYNLDANHITGFEALIRWRHPRRGIIPPAEFIPLAEETGLIWSIGRWVLYEACRQTQAWQNRFPHLTINVNVSGCQISNPDFAGVVENILRETGLQGHSLKLEITESVVVTVSDAIIFTFNRLKKLGVQIHIDDFGTGYSSLSYLQAYPIDSIKIDRSFITKIGPDHSSDIVRTLIMMAREMGMEAIAEGIETEEQLSGLKAYGCHYGQGYLLSRPVDAFDAERFTRGAQWNQNPSPLTAEG